jgi:GMP synthase (glutamine-hydrolysing)
MEVLPTMTMPNIHADRILILDFGSQYTQLIARRVREAGVYSELHPYDVSEEFIREFNPKGIILSGGPESVHQDNTPRAHSCVFTCGVPVLGICYGMQTLASQLGGQVDSAIAHEYGHAEVTVCAPSPLLTGTYEPDNPSLQVWMSHADKVSVLPPGFAVIASTPDAPLAAIADERRKFYGVQFHPEVTHTVKGQDILNRFIHDICGCHNDWTPFNIIEDSIQSIQQQVGDDEVLLGLSGGVDSSVVALLVHRAIGERLTCVFVDNGLLRLNEGDGVMETFARHMGVKVIRVDAADVFMSRLAGVTDPEQKRKIIGNTFVAVFEEEAKKIPGVAWLAQGTIYPDVIESAGAASGKAKVIKSHHNVGGLPERMKLKLLEPLKELFKDEVRKIGEELGLAHEMVYRHPFPGPGLGVRILGEVTTEYADILRQADDIFIHALIEHDLYHKVSQAFAVFLPVKSVGVTGDNRNYNYVIALRAVETIDFMTARWAPLPYDFLDQVSRKIINRISAVSRVVYDISGKPPATIEWE